MPGGPAGPPTNNVRMFHLKFDIFQMSNLIFFKYLKYLEYPVYLKYPKYPAANPENLKFYIIHCYLKMSAYSTLKLDVHMELNI